MRMFTEGMADQLDAIKHIPFMYLFGEKDVLCTAEAGKHWEDAMLAKGMTAEFITCEGLDHYENHAGKHAGVFFGNGEGISKLFDFLTKAKKA